MWHWNSNWELISDLQVDRERACFWRLKTHPSDIPPSQTVPPTGDQALEHMSLWGHSHPSLRSVTVTKCRRPGNSQMLKLKSCLSTVSHTHWLCSSCRQPRCGEAHRTACINSMHELHHVIGAAWACGWATMSPLNWFSVGSRATPTSSSQPSLLHSQT